jgi:hypothetical protein
MCAPVAFLQSNKTNDIIILVMALQTCDSVEERVTKVEDGHVRVNLPSLS